MIGCVVLTTGSRPDVLALALDSLRAQRGVELDTVVVFNGAQVPPGVRGVVIGTVVGIPAGRNAGVPEVKGDLLFFLDDDARLDGPTTLADLAARFERDPRLGLVQPRVDDPDGRPAPGRWVPRVRAGDHAEPGPATSLWEGAVVVRRSVFERAGGWPSPFWYAHEGIDLAWRVMDAGYRVEYAGDIAVEHPMPPPVPARHWYSLQLGVRNRVWVARRNLRFPIAVLYVLSFTLRALLRVRSAGDLRAVAKGLRDGVREPCGTRKPLSARTLWRMTRLGRPPVI